MEKINNITTKLLVTTEAPEGQKARRQLKLRGCVKDGNAGRTAIFLVT